MSDERIRPWIAFNMVRGIGPARLRLLRDYFGSLDAAWEASPLELARAGLDRRSIDALVTTRQNIDLDATMRRLDQLHVTVLTWDDPAYPQSLRTIDAPPPVLYVRGELTSRDEWAVAVVGTRRPTAYGREVASMLAAGLARHGVTVVSGLARGIDGAAHQGALAGGGRTIAVLGSGIDIIYPAEHRRLAEEIIGHGALVSDYPVGTPPEAANFPPRNRIISGLSRGVVVVEGAEDSGALITADDAMEQGREVFAVPGNILARQSGGTNKLIQQGAKLVTSVEDILEDLNMVQATQQMEVQAAVPDNPLEARILTLLSGEPLHIDEISRQVGLPISQVSATLALMELKGMVHQVGSMTYVVARERRAGYHVD